MERNSLSNFGKGSSKEPFCEIISKSRNMHVYFKLPWLWRSWLVGLGLTALSDSISVYIGPSPKEREKEENQNSAESGVAPAPHSTPIPTKR